MNPPLTFVSEPMLSVSRYIVSTLSSVFRSIGPSLQLHAVMQFKTKIRAFQSATVRFGQSKEGDAKVAFILKLLRPSPEIVNCLYYVRLKVCSHALYPPV